MTAYEFYWVDERRDSHFFAILPERRKNSERIIEESIGNWGRAVFGDRTETKKIYFIQVEV